MLFFDEAGVSSDVHENAIPGDLTPIPARARSQFVLEINGGAAQDLGIEPGAELRHPAVDRDRRGLELRRLNADRKPSCGHPGSNRDSRRKGFLRPQRLPIPPCPRGACNSAPPREREPGLSRDQRRVGSPSVESVRRRRRTPASQRAMPAISGSVASSRPNSESSGSTCSRSSSCNPTLAIRPDLDAPHHAAGRRSPEPPRRASACRRAARPPSRRSSGPARRDRSRARRTAATSATAVSPRIGSSPNSRPSRRATSGLSRNRLSSRASRSRGNRK